MAKSRRMRLDAELREVLGSGVHLYFQPPESKKLEYPCLVYEHTRNHLMNANNMPYAVIPAYELTYISKDPDDPMNTKLAYAFSMISFIRHFTIDNLNHDVYILYY